MLCREIIAVCSRIHTKHINTLCGQNVELLNFKPGGTYSEWPLEFIGVKFTSQKYNGEIVNGFQLAQNRDPFWGGKSAVIDLRVAYNTGEFRD